MEHVRIDPGATVVTPLDFYDYPISHSLLGTLVWAAMFAVLYFVSRKNWLGAGILAVGVASHWFLDLLMHRPDLPVLPNGPYVGFGLWNSLAGTMVLEGAIFAAAAFVYIKATKSSDRIGTYGFGGLLAFLVLVWIGNIFGEPPPSDTVVAVAANALWLVVAWAYWVDRHRTS